MQEPTSDQHGVQNILKNDHLFFDGLVCIWGISVVVGGLPMGANLRLTRSEGFCGIVEYAQTNLLIWKVPFEETYGILDNKYHELLQ